MSANPRPRLRLDGFFRCSGPNCGVMKNPRDHWWLLWTSYDNGRQPIFSLAPWDDDLALEQGAVYACGESCAQKLQSQFMGNVRENQLKRQNRP